MTRVGLFHLTEAQLELMSAMAQKPELEVVAAVHPNADDAVYKIAQVLEVPTATGVDSLREHGAEIVVIPERDDGLESELTRAGFADIHILSTREAAERWGLSEEISADTRTLGGEAAAPVTRHGDGEIAVGPDLENMLRDGLDALTDSEDDLATKLGQLAAEWARLVDARACALLIDDPEQVGETLWVTGGPRGDQVTGPDTVVRAALEGVPHIYVKHAVGADGPQRALGAFPLEKVRGAVWFHDFRLPPQAGEERLQAIRRGARRLGRLLAIEGRVRRLARDRDAAMRVADLADSMAQAESRDEILDKLVEAIRAEVGADLIVLRVEGEAEPRVIDVGLPGELLAARGMLVAAEDELARSARVSLRTRQQPAMLVGERVVGGMSSPLRRGNELLGTVSIFSSQTRGAGELYGDRERLLLERLALHAAGSLALLEHDVRQEAGGESVHGLLGFKELEALLRAEVKRTDRYQVPFLLTVIDLVEPSEWESAPAAESFSAEFAQELKRRLREVDHLARLGSQRFAVLNPHTDRSGGRVVVRAQEVLKQLDQRYPGAGAVDVHGNQVLYPGDVPTFEDLIQRLQS